MTHNERESCGPERWGICLASDVNRIAALESPWKKQKFASKTFSWGHFDMRVSNMLTDFRRNYAARFNGQKIANRLLHTKKHCKTSASLLTSQQGETSIRNQWPQPKLIITIDRPSYYYLPPPPGGGEMNEKWKFRGWALLFSLEPLLLFTILQFTLQIACAKAALIQYSPIEIDSGGRRSQ